MYKILNRSGSFGDDFNHDIKTGDWLIPVYAMLPDRDLQLMYMPCTVKAINNTGRYQVIIATDEDGYPDMFGYTGNQQLFKVCYNDNYAEWLKEDAEIADVEDFMQIWRSLGGE